MESLRLFHTNLYGADKIVTQIETQKCHCECDRSLLSMQR